MYVIKNKTIGMYYVSGGWTTNAKDAMTFLKSDTANLMMCSLIKNCNHEFEVVKL